jgi:hypothetical protein
MEESLPGGNSVRWRRATFALLGAYVLALVFGFGAGEPVGDASDYYLMMIVWAEGLQPQSTDATGKAYDAYAATRITSPPFVPYARLTRWAEKLGSAPGELDLAHFWLYSLGAAVFYWPLKLLGADVGLSFNLLHAALVLLSGWILYRHHGHLGVLGLLTLLVASPLLWFANKAHTEFFTVMTTTVALSYFGKGLYGRCAVFFALASAQNPPLAFPALLALGIGLEHHRERLLKEQLGACLLSGAILALHPAYYLIRLGAITPGFLTGGADMTSELLPLKRMASFFIDIETGLLASWPLGVFILGAFALLCWRRPHRQSGRWALFVSVTVLLLSWSQARTTNLNHGGTVYLSRYALWYLCLFSPMLLVIYRWLAPRKRPWKGAALAVLLVLGGLNGWLFRVHRPGEYLRPSPAARVVYRYFPGVYDPPPEVFVERQLHWDAALTYRAFDEVWAVGTVGATKILVDRRKLNALPGDAIPEVVNCPELDASRVHRMARSYFAEHPEESFVYLNGMQEQLRRR